jgi:hypothetical protein
MPAVIGFDYGDLWKWEDFDPSRLSRSTCNFREFTFHALR